MQHCVYWLFDPATKELLYIGRSHEPDRRKRDFERLYERKTFFGTHNRFTQLEEAQEHERLMIQKHQPPYNKRIASSPSNLGMKRPPVSEATREKMRAAKAGKKLNPEHKAAISAGLQGNKNNLGRIPSEVTRLKMSASHTRTRTE